MVREIAQKATKLYFHCDPLKNDISKLKKKSRRGKIESLGKNLDIVIEKKVRLYLSSFI